MKYCPTSVASLLLAVAALSMPAFGTGQVSISTFGARGDGATDDGAAMQSAIDAAAPGAVLVWPKTAGCYRTAATLVVKKPLTLRGPGAICMTAPDRTLLSISSGNVTIDGLTLKGPQHDEYRDRERAIAILGTAGAPPDYIHHISIKNTVISNWGGYAIISAFVDGFSYVGNTISEIGFTGIQGLSVRNGSASRNSVADVTSKGLPEDNAYGFIFSRGTDDAGELVTQPRSANVVITDNIVHGVPTWTCFDTHAGENVSFLNNFGTGCKFGIGAGPAKDHLNKYKYAPLKITITNNTLDSAPLARGTAENGIVFQGVVGGEYATGSIGSNVVVGYGNSTSPLGAAVEIQATKDLVVSGLTIRDPSPVGILLYGSNKGLSIVGTTIADPWTDSTARVGEVEGIYSKGGNNEATVSGLVVKGIHPHEAALVLTGKSGVAIRLGDDAGGSFVINGVDTNAKIPLLVGAHSVVRKAP